MKIKEIDDINETVDESETNYYRYRSDWSGMQPGSDTKKTWAMWFVAGRVYNAWWHSGQDFTHLNIRKLNFARDEPAIVFKFNYTLFRELYRIKAGSTYPRISMYDIDRDNCLSGEYYH